MPLIPPNRRHIRAPLSVPYQLRAQRADVGRHIPSGHTQKGDVVLVFLFFFFVEYATLAHTRTAAHTGGKEYIINRDDIPLKKTSSVASKTGGATTDGYRPSGEKSCPARTASSSPQRSATHWPLFGQQADTFLRCKLGR